MTIDSKYLSRKLYVKIKYNIFMAITFKYKKIERPEPVGTIFTPSIPVTLINKDNSVDVIALLDSGADVSFIPYGISEILGLDLKDKKEVIGIGGKIQAFETSHSTVCCKQAKLV